MIAESIDRHKRNLRLFLPILPSLKENVTAGHAASQFANLFLFINHSGVGKIGEMYKHPPLFLAKKNDIALQLVQHALWLEPIRLRHARTYLLPMSR